MGKSNGKSGKKSTFIRTTGFQRIIGVLLPVIATVYALFHGVMTVMNKMIVNTTPWSTLNEALLWITLAVGAVYLIYMGFLHPQSKLILGKGIKRIFSPEYILLLVLLVLLLISVASANSVFKGDWWKANRGQLLDAAGQILILFPLGCYLARNRDRKFIRYPLCAIVIAFTAAEAWALITIYSNSLVTLPNGGQIGINMDLALQINCNPNTTGLWGYCMMFLALYLCVTAEKPLKPVFILCMLISFLTIVHSRSRASEYSVCLAAGLSTAIFVLYRKKWFRNNTGLRIPVSILSGIAVTVALYFLKKLIFSTYLKDMGFEGSSRDFVDATFSGRLLIWEAALKALVYDTREFFFGITFRGVYDRISELLAMDEMLYTHNQILEIGVACGVPAMLVFIAYCVKLFLNSIKVCFTSGNTAFRNALPSIGCFLLLMGNMMEATLVGYNYLSGVIFMIACGCLTELNRNPSLLSRELPEDAI